MVDSNLVLYYFGISWQPSFFPTVSHLISSVLYLPIFMSQFFSIRDFTSVFTLLRVLLQYFLLYMLLSLVSLWTLSLRWSGSLSFCFICSSIFLHSASNTLWFEICSAENLLWFAFPTFFTPSTLCSTKIIMFFFFFLQVSSSYHPLNFSLIKSPPCTAVFLPWHVSVWSWLDHWVGMMCWFLCSLNSLRGWDACRLLFRGHLQCVNFNREQQSLFN